MDPAGSDTLVVIAVFTRPGIYTEFYYDNFGLLVYMELIYKYSRKITNQCKMKTSLQVRCRFTEKENN